MPQTLATDHTAIMPTPNARLPLLFDHTGESRVYVTTKPTRSPRTRQTIIPAGARLFFTEDLLANWPQEPVTLQYETGAPTEPGGFVVFRTVQDAELWLVRAGLELAPVAP